MTQLLEGKTVKTRWYKFPYENRAIDETLQLKGFSSALNQAIGFLTGNLKISKEELNNQVENTQDRLGHL